MTAATHASRWTGLLTLLILNAACGSSQPAQAGAERAQGSAVSSREMECLALNLYWEARGESRESMLAVGWTVLNRVHSPEFPGSVCGVIYQGGETPPCQFSWWCDGRSDRPTEIESWRRSQRIATELLLDPPRDPTKGALFYHNRSIRAPWKRPRTATIGAHIFYR